MTTFLVLVRCLNIALAIIALETNLDKMIRYKLWRIIESDAVYRWLSLFGLFLAYIFGTTLAMISNVPVGPWTIVWTPPLAWAAISGFMSRNSGNPVQDARKH